jgi:type III pantothenate kinase
MVVTIDIGNTNITIGCFSRKSDEIINYASLRTDRLLTTDDLAIKYSNLVSLWGLQGKTLDKVVISSVVPTLDYPFKHMFEKYFNVSPIFVVKENVPITINYDFPREIGADRIVNAYAGICMFPQRNLVIVDFGTATTFDIVSDKGTYEGGVIVPGIMTSLRSMEEKAAKLPHIDLLSKTAVVGKNTIDGIRSGIINGTASMVDGIVARIAGETGFKDIKVIATGGLSELIISVSSSIELIDKHLTLKGLYYIWKLHNGKKA